VIFHFFHFSTPSSPQHHQPASSIMTTTTDDNDATTTTTTALSAFANQEQEQKDPQDQPQDQDPEYPDLSLNDIIDGDNGRGIPSVKFVSEDVGMFVDGLFGPGNSGNSGSTGNGTVSAELLIGAFSQLHAKYKSSEASLQGKRTCPNSPTHHYL
jgi:hypothetical protein